MITNLIFILLARVPDGLGDPLGQKELCLRQGEAEVGPGVTILKSSHRIAGEIDLTFEIGFEKGFHRDVFPGVLRGKGGVVELDKRLVELGRRWKEADIGGIEERKRREGHQNEQDWIHGERDREDHVDCQRDTQQGG